jgi:VIT1/CCC1 family predicted Fe2+/Mn2+ transporter
MPPIIEQLKLDHSKMINDSYLSLMTSSRLPKWKILIQKFHQKTGELTFGITSGIMTTIGLLTGMNSATSSKIAVLAAIAVIACADSLSDSCGMFLSKLAERGTSTKTAISYALGTLAGKFLFPLTFILPIVLCDNLTTGVIIDIVWGLIALSLLTIEQALVKEESILKSLGRNLAIAITGIALSTMVGKLIAWLIAN